MMQQPGFQQAMSQVLADPRMVDHLIQSQPQLQAMGPGIRQYMQSEEFRRTMTDPTILRSIFEMNRMFSQYGMQMPGMPAAQQRPAFPAPGVTDTTPQHQQGNRSATGSPPPTAPQQQANPFSSLFPQQHAQGANQQANPFATLFPGMPPPGAQSNLGGVQSPFGSPPPQGQTGQQQQNPFGTGPFNPYVNQQQAPFGQNQPNNPYGMLNPAALQMLLGQGGQNPLSPGGTQQPFINPTAAPTTTAPIDTRPIEERFQVCVFLLNSNGRRN
jgi:ubiquilin